MIHVKLENLRKTCKNLICFHKYQMTGYLDICILSPVIAINIGFSLGQHRMIYSFCHRSFLLLIGNKFLFFTISKKIKCLTNVMAEI